MNILHNDIIQFILYIAVFILIFYVIEKTARKKWQIVKRSEAHEVNAFHKWGKRILGGIFFATIVFFPSGSGVKGALIIMMTLAFDSYMQWKHENAKREYIITFLGLIVFIVFISIGFSFDLLL